ncbi:uncharacterized protein LOC116348372 [Contarinia nasturtii]|uniref:uncharacterized protein LOC116348372 n=1 Tax=Contarinia nasturtii TaxID=265458 RepID=UPI0012D3AC3F|nr:uncharacterized protein LOC116348372 [Contarinia nasturtii]
MTIFFYTLLFTMILNECNGAPNFISKLFRPKSTGDINTENYDGDPIVISCFTERTQRELYQVEINGTWPVSLLQRLDNGNFLSLIFHGAANEITKKAGLMFWFARDYFKASGNNICIITYAYTTEPSVGCSKAVSNLNKMVTSKRLDYVARLSADLIIGIQDICWNDEDGGRCLNIHEVDIIGFSFGAHVAGRTCEYISEKTKGEKVRLLLALDPSKTPLLMAKPKSTIKRGVAHLVQVIHTSIIGITQQIGDIDIYVTKSKLGIAVSLEHGLDFFVFLATATKKLYLLAEKNGNGTMIRQGEPFREPGPKECVVGVYSNPNPNQYGKMFEISLVNRTKTFKEALGMYYNEDIFFE